MGLTIYKFIDSTFKLSLKPQYEEVFVFYYKEQSD